MAGRYIFTEISVNVGIPAETSAECIRPQMFFATNKSFESKPEYITFRILFLFQVESGLVIISLLDWGILLLSALGNSSFSKNKLNHRLPASWV